MKEQTKAMVIESYARLKNLKLVGLETGISWQNVYLILKDAGVAVTGDKARYGSVTDRVAVIGESMFKKSVPFAVDNNNLAWQSSIDFSVGNTTIDIKTSRLSDAKLRGRQKTPRWAFCISKQKDIADFFVLYALEKDVDKARFIFLIPREIATTKTTISIPSNLNSKWADYIVTEYDLLDFFCRIAKMNKITA